MTLRILNKDFQHPADGWYQIEATGNHPNRAAGVVQVIDTDATLAIVNRFNAEAAAGKLRHGNEMLIDHEHFSDQPDQETRAYGWLQELQNREDGIYGRVRWTTTGKAAVDGGDYRFFSTEYEPADLQVLNPDKPRRVRPLALAGLTLTNMNNNRGQKPITNRAAIMQNKSIVIPAKPLPADRQCPDCRVMLEGDEDDGSGVMVCPECQTHFAGPGGSAGSKQTTKTKNRHMKTVCTLLGLSAEADEQSVHAAVSKLLNRTAELEPLAAENATLKNRIAEVDANAVDSILASHGVKEPKVLNRLKPVLLALPTQAERTAALADFGFKPVDAGKPAGTKVLNRGTGTLPETETADSTDEKAIARKITNRATELRSKGITWDNAWRQAQREVAAK